MPGLETGRYQLPLLAVSQAHKEVTHNEALVLIDALLHLSVESALPAPPSVDDSDIGKCWLIAGTPNGPWANRSGQIAIWTGGSWRFLPPHAGMRLWNKSTGCQNMYIVDQWTSPAEIPNPAGGSVVDIEARVVLALILQYFRSIGILAT